MERTRISGRLYTLPEGGREVNRRYVSVTDPQAALMSRGKGAKLLYKTHRAVDAKAEVITAAEVSRDGEDAVVRLTSRRR